MPINISEINRSLTTFDGTERTIAYDATLLKNFKDVGRFDVKEKIAPGYKNFIIDGDFNHWSEATSYSSFGYTSDVWFWQEQAGGGGVGTVTRQDNIDPDVASHFLRVSMTSAAPNVFMEQKLKDVSLIAGKNTSMFIRAKSSTGVSTLVYQVIRWDGSSEHSNITSGQTVPSDDTWRWYRFNLAVTDLSALTITAGNLTKIRIRNNADETFILDIDKVRVIETPANLAAGDIPEWIKCNENPEYTKQLVRKYYIKIRGEFLTPMIYARGIDTNTIQCAIPISTEMVQLPDVTMDVAVNHWANITTGVGIGLSGTETISHVEISTDQVFFRVNDTGKFVGNNTYYAFLREDQSRYIRLDARY